MKLLMETQEMLMNEIVNKIEVNTSLNAQGTYDRHAPTLNTFFEVSEDVYFVVHAPNATNDDNEEFINTICLQVMKDEEPILENCYIEDMDELMDELNAAQILG